MFSILAALITLGGFVNAQGYVSMPFTKESLDEELSENTSLHKRVVFGDLRNSFERYTVRFSLGDNQKQKCILDTGSSDIWVFNDWLTAPLTYNPSGAELISRKFQKSYNDGSFATGSYYKDKLTLGGVTVTTQFGVSDFFEDKNPYGRFGIGPSDSGNCCNGKCSDGSYPWVLKNEGEIETASYSLNLITENSNSGNIVFGAVATNLYSGKLQLMDNQGTGEFAVPFSVLGSELVGVLDSASVYTYLPDDIVASFAASIGAVWSDDRKSYITYQRSESNFLSFNFSGTEIFVVDSELLKQGDESDPLLTLTVKPISQSNGKVILGESFLRSAYTVYDLERNQVAIGQAVSSDSPNYQSISSSGIPGASF